MRKTIRNGIGRRAVYKFKCSGPCNKTKHTYVYERAKNGFCLSCSKNGADSNQASLFIDTNSVRMQDSNGNKHEIRGVEHLANNIFLDPFTGKKIDVSSMEDIN